MSTIIQFRRGTAAEWTAANPILAEGEKGIETDGLGTTEIKEKIGNGVLAWNDLPYKRNGGGIVDSVNGKNEADVFLYGTDIELVNGGIVTVTEAISDLLTEVTDLEANKQDIKILGKTLESNGSILNLTTSGADRAVTSTPLPFNSGEEMIVETRFHTVSGTSYSISIEGTNGLVIGKFGNNLICGFNGGGLFTTSVANFEESITGTDLKLIYTRSTGAISVFCNGNKTELVTDSLTPVSELLGGNLSLGSRFSPANNFTDGFFDYFKITIDNIPIVDYEFNEGTGTTVIDSIGGHDLTIEGSGYSWSDINSKRDNSLNIGFIGDSNCVSRATAEEVVKANPSLPLDGNIDSVAYWGGISFEQSKLNMNLGGDVGIGQYGVEYVISEKIKTELDRNTNILKYALGGSQCTNGGAWNSVNGSLMRGFLSEANKSKIELDVIVVFLGENSATNATDSGNYESEQLLLIDKIRYNIKNGINIPIILVRLYDFTAANIIAEIPTIQAAHDNIELTKRKVTLVHPQKITSVKSDDAHFDGYGINALGFEIFKEIKRVV